MNIELRWLVLPGPVEHSQPRLQFRHQILATATFTEWQDVPIVVLPEIRTVTAGARGS